MLTINKNGQVEPINKYSTLEIEEEINGIYNLSCTFLNTSDNQYAWDLIAEESIIENDGHEYRIKKMTKDMQRKIVNAPHIFFDLVDHQIYSMRGGTLTVQNAFAFILYGSGWTFEVMESIPAKMIPNFGEDNALALIRQSCDAFECEIKIEPNKHLKIYKKIGKDNDYQFRYKHNIKSIKETVDTTKLATVIRGYGGNGLEVTYTSPNIAIFGERHAEPLRDDRFTLAESLIERCKQELVDTPDVSIEVEAIMLDKASLGDMVWLIHEPLGIEFQTRIMSKKSRPQTPKADTVTLGNLKATLTDLLAESKVAISENNKQIRSRIEQTNERITLEVEAVNESFATLQLEADNIKLSVEEVEQSVSAVNVRADNITLSVQQLDNRVGSTESQLYIQAGQLLSKVSYSDYNGNTIASMINQTASSITLDASKINLLGITHVANNISIGASGLNQHREIRFNGANVISDDGTHMRLSAHYLHVGDTYTYFRNYVDFSAANVTGLNIQARFG